MSTLVGRGTRPLTGFAGLLEWPFAALALAAGHTLPAEAWISDNQYVLRVELPGVDPERDIEVTVAGGALTISAERRPQLPDRHSSEFRYGTFTRHFTLPPGADEQRVRAMYGHGILEITADLTAGPGERPGRRVPILVNQHIKPT